MSNVYYVNMKKAKSRQNRMREMFSGSKLRVTRVAACEPDMVDDILPYVTPYKRELAATISHLKAINQAYLDGCETALILEDDATMSVAATQVRKIEDLMKRAPKGCECLHLFGLQGLYHARFNGLEDREFVKNSEYPSYMAAGYMVNRAGMRKMSRHVAHTDSGMRVYPFYDDNDFDHPLYNHRADYWADHFLFCRMNTYRTTMPCISIRGVKSQIQQHGNDRMDEYHSVHQKEMKIVADYFLKFPVTK